jgi:hypothetical protein
MTPLRRHARTLVAVLACAGCVSEAPRWEDRPVPTRDAVESILGLGSAACFDRDLLPAEVPVVPPKLRLRPCCAFGYALKPELAAIPIPGVVLQNVTSAADLGPHRYDGGVLALERDADQSTSSERNGLVYTCRGGFIDTAHVRDHADWTMYLAPSIARILEQGGRIPLPDEGATRAVVLAPLPTAQIETYGRRRIAVSIAEWLAFQMSIWHEIATWYGWSALPMFPERASAFSPEDLYSNALGARLAGGVIAVRAAATDRTYERTLDRWLAEALAELGAVDAEQGMAAADRVDGLWWDSQRRVPDERLVLRRSFGISAPIEPWTVGRSGPEARAWETAHCPDGAAPLPLHLPEQLGEIRFADVATLELVLEPPLRERIPSADSRLTQADFPGLVEAIREQARAEFGPRVELPER